MALSSPLTVVGLMNGMIGGVILVLPVSSYQAGYAFTILAIIFSGAFSYYSCYLSIKHLGNQKDMNYSMQAHFGNQIAKIIYDIVVWLGLLLGSMFYYGLICIQWESITGDKSIAIPLINAGVLFLLIFILKYFDFGASLMAYGIISIFAYMIFLIWVLSSAPKGQASWKPFGTNLYTFGATMSLAFAIQAFFIPVLMKNPLKNKHTLLTLIAYVIGACIYVYISFMGSFGIMNRTPINSDPQTIEDYFKVGNVELRIIQSIYLIHLYSCLPEFVLISKKRLFNTFRIKQTVKGKVPIKQIVYSAIFLGICLLIRLLGVKIDTIIAINGAIIGFFNIYFFPAILHVKCLYFSNNKRSLQEHNKLSQQKSQKPDNIELNLKNYYTLSDTQRHSNRDSVEIRDPFFANKQLSSYKSQAKRKINQSQNYSKTDSMKKAQIQKTQQQYNNQETDKNQEPQIDIYFVCDCQQPKNLFMKILQMIVIIAMVALGAAIMVNGLISVI